ncbi:MAG TPA: MFS transporter [Bryobacteraceae bacterium]|nr:MFS transporter [Bryobacteraceae bacterium]
MRWYIAALLFTASVINYIDRQTLSIVAPVLTRELGISPIEYSNILQAFLIAYALMQLGSGILVDRWGARISLAVFMAWWSLSNVLHALARSAFSLGVFRFLLGAGEPGNFMAAFKAISEWYPPKERAFVNGLVNAGAALGAIVATPLVAWLTVRYGWRTSFVVTGCLGFVWLAVWLLLYQRPEEHRWITSAEMTVIRQEETGAESAHPAATLSRSELFRYPQTWGLLLARFISDPVWWFYLFWMPKYLVEQRGFSMVEMGMLAWLPYLSADLGSVSGGLVSGYLVNRKWQPLNARAAAMLPCALLMPLSVLIALTPSPALALVLICVVTFAHMGWKTNLMTVTNDIYPTRVVGSISGAIAFGSGLGGTLFTNLTGQVVERFSYTWIFVIMGFLHPAAFVVFRMLVRGPIRQPAAEPINPARAVL